jgi:hypothetical protein
VDRRFGRGRCPHPARRLLLGRRHCWVSSAVAKAGNLATAHDVMS